MEESALSLNSVENRETIIVFLSGIFRDDSGSWPVTVDEFRGLHTRVQAMLLKDNEVPSDDEVAEELNKIAGALFSLEPASLLTDLKYSQFWATFRTYKDFYLHQGFADDLSDMTVKMLANAAKDNALYHLMSPFREEADWKKPDLDRVVSNLTQDVGSNDPDVLLSVLEDREQHFKGVLEFNDRNDFSQFDDWAWGDFLILSAKLRTHIQSVGRTEYSQTQNVTQRILSHSTTISGGEEWLADARLIPPSYDLFNGECFEDVTFWEYASLFDRSIPPRVQLSYLKPAGQKIFTYFLMKIAVSDKDGIERFNIPGIKNQKMRIRNGESKSRIEAVMQNEIDRFLKKYTPGTL